MGYSVRGKLFIHYSPHNRHLRCQAGFKPYEHQNCGEKSYVYNVRGRAFRDLQGFEEITLERKPVKVRNMGKPLVLQLHFKYMKESTLERNYIDVNNMEKPIDIIKLFKHMKELTQARTPVNAFVVKL